MIKLALDRQNRTGWLFADRLLTARSATNDIVEVVPVGESHATLLVGDVHGRGATAHASRCTLRQLLRKRMADSSPAPAELVEEANRWVCTVKELYASLWVGTLDLYSGQLAYAVAGHPPALVIRGDEFAADGRPVVNLAGEAAGLLGTQKMLAPPQGQLTLDERDVLVLYTDGLLEKTADTGRSLTHAEFRSVVVDHISKDIPATLLSILNTVRGLTASESGGDDASLLMIQRAAAYDAACTYTRLVARKAATYAARA